MRELLIKWAELETSRCEKSGKNVFTIEVDGEAKNIYGPDNLTGLDLAWIGWAVQQAVVSRGWGYSTGYDRTLVFGNCEADVEFSPRSGAHEQGDNPAEALLKAYLRALEVAR